MGSSTMPRAARRHNRKRLDSKGTPTNRAVTLPRENANEDVARLLERAEKRVLRFYDGHTLWTIEIVIGVLLVTWDHVLTLGGRNRGLRPRETCIFPSSGPDWVG